MKLSIRQLRKLISEVVKESRASNFEDYRNRRYDYQIGRGFERYDHGRDYLNLIEKVNALDFEELEQLYPGISMLESRVHTEQALTLMYIDMYLDSAQYERIVPLIRGADSVAANLGRTRPGNRSYSS